MTDGTPVTDEEREILRRDIAEIGYEIENFDSVDIRRVTKPPKLGVKFKKIGDSVVFLVLSASTVVGVLLLPKNIEDTFQYYRPVGELAYNRLKTIAGEFSEDTPYPDHLAETDKFIVFDSYNLPFVTTTTTMPPQSPEAEFGNGTGTGEGSASFTLIASSGVPDDLPRESMRADDDYYLL